MLRFQYIFHRDKYAFSLRIHTFICVNHPILKENYPILSSPRLNPSLQHLINQFIYAARSVQPMGVRLAAKPRSLPFGILARRGLPQFEGRPEVALAAQETAQLFVADASQRGRVFAPFVEQCPRFIEGALAHHSFDSRVNAFD